MHSHVTGVIYDNSSMLIVWPCQQHRLVVMHPNDAKSLPASTVPAAAKLGHRRGKRGIRSEDRKLLVVHMLVSRRVDYREVEAWWQYRTQLVERSKART